MVATRLARYSWLRPCSDAFALVELDPRRGAVDAVDGFRDLGLVDDQRWQHAHHIVSGRDGEQPLGTQCLDQLAVRADSEEPEQKALAAHLGDHAGVAIPDLGETLAKQDRAAADLFEKLGRE